MINALTGEFLLRYKNFSLSKTELKENVSKMDSESEGSPHVNTGLVRVRSFSFFADDFLHLGGFSRPALPGYPVLGKNNFLCGRTLDPFFSF